MPETWTNDDGKQVELTDGEIFILQWQRRMHGHFFTSLMDAAACADVQNLARLREAFPLEIQAFVEWRHGDMHKRLEAKGFSL